MLLGAGVAIVDAHGDEMASSLLPVVEKHLERTAQASDARYDQVREGAVILLGTIGGHLQTGDAKVRYEPLIHLQIDIADTAEVDNAIMQSAGYSSWQ